MRALTLVWLALLGGVADLAAQHGHEYEFGGFGSYTKYDASFKLANKIGGGARLGYLFGRLIELEVDVVLQPEYKLPSNATIEPLIGGVSLGLNLLHGERNILYVLGGYSRLDFGASSPYTFTDGGIHGAIGDRIFLTHHIALRLEARAIYTPSTKSTFSTSAVTHMLGTVGLSVFAPSKKRVAAPPPAHVPPPAPAVTPTHAPAAPALPARAQDSDQDGVPDSVDACPNTPFGAKVDERGCPVDSDHDGVPDGLDKCPDTPAGAVVDASGCSVDSDHDGVPDGIDKCPDTPAGASVDATGCPVDSDHDGVPDGIDKCPNTPAGATVDASGCPMDSDHDGVPDGIDKCPNTPLGTPVDATGCPMSRDSDGDGVPDSLDKCPNTPKGVPVDANGCMILFQPAPTTPAKPGAPPARPTLILRGVNFETGRSVLTAESYAVLDQVAASLAANPDIRIEIAGYTDATGPVGINIQLSAARAAAVRAYLARKGVAPLRMVARGYGARNPIATNATPAGRAQNRRVELHKLP